MNSRVVAVRIPVWLYNKLSELSEDCKNVPLSFVGREAIFYAVNKEDFVFNLKERVENLDELLHEKDNDRELRLSLKKLFFVTNLERKVKGLIAQGINPIIIYELLKSYRVYCVSRKWEKQVEIIDIMISDYERGGLLDTVKSRN